MQIILNLIFKKIPLRKGVNLIMIILNTMATVLFHKQDLFPEVPAKIL